LKHFIPLLPSKSRCIFATLSARVGSIGDNRKGGWYGYRASKAARNMLLQTAAIEACRQRPQAVFAALQPGTVRSRLSAPFAAGTDAMEPDVSAALLLGTLDTLPASGAAVFIDYQGRPIAW
jgi:NAD(P)-dependent dehydrogenase (short-subunit alcohol dehydrogenase family)